MRALMPWMGFPSVRQEMEKLFERFADSKLDEFPATGEWAPSMDVSETKDAVMVKAEVPGMDPKDIQISLQEQLLTIKGEKQMEKEEKEERYYRVERTYGAFTRSVRQPVLEGCGNLGAIHRHGQTDTPREGSVGPLHAVITLLLLLLLHLLLALDGQELLLERDLNVLRVHARNFRLDHHGVLRLGHVH